MFLAFPGWARKKVILFGGKKWEQTGAQSRISAARTPTPLPLPGDKKIPEPGESLYLSRELKGPLYKGS